MRQFFSHWRTTAAGIAVGALNMYAHGTSPRMVGLSVGVAVLGILAQDAPVAGAAVKLEEAGKGEKQ